ncbi:MAG: DsbA family oxidoreductase [Acidimicrobiales bacterium]
MTSFAINWDYRCPFARNMHEHLVTALQGGAPWKVDFVPFSLGQVHVEEGGLSVWDDPSKENELLAVAAGLTVHHQLPEAFLDFHRAMFRARHDLAQDISDWNVIAKVLGEHQINAELVYKAIEQGDILAEYRERHTDSVERLAVFGVPTFIIGETATFVRVMTRPTGDPQHSIDLITSLLNVMGQHPEFNEIKQTTIPR